MALTTVNAVLVFIALIACAATAAAPAAPARAGKLSIGWASVDITPPKPVPLCGQFGLRISQRVNDPLTATALAIEARDDAGILDQTVMVSCDLVAIQKQIQTRLRELVRPRLPDLDVGKIIINTTHTHTAPALADATEENLHPYDVMGVFVYRIPSEGVMKPPEYVEFLLGKLADAVADAWKARKPGAVSWGLGYAVVGHNRRAVYADGRAQMYGATDKPEFRSFESSEDPGVELLFCWDQDRKLTGAAINVACTSQEVESANYVSADFWHDVRVELHKRHGPGLFVLPLTGAAGDQSPHLLFRKQAEATLRKRKGVSARQEIGLRIAAAFDATLPLAKADVRAEVPFAHKIQELPLPVRKVTKAEYERAKAEFKPLDSKELEKLDSPAYIWWRIRRNIIAKYEIQEKEPTYLTEVHTLRIGDVAVATNPFELYIDYGLRIKARSPAEQTLIVQLACDALAYLPTERGVAGGHYSAEIMSNIVGPEGGQMLVEKTVESLKAMWPTSGP